MSDNWFYDGFINEVKNIARPGSGGSVPKPLTYDYMPEGYPSKSGWSIEWDGNTEGLVSVADAIYKTSDLVPTDDELIGRFIHISNGTSVIISSDYINAGSEDLTFVGDPEIVVVKKDNATFKGVTFPQKGTYFLKVNDVYVQKLTEIITPMAEEFIPNIPADKIPSINTTALPNIPADKIPSINTTALPNIPADKIPSINTTALPNIPAGKVNGVVQYYSQSLSDAQKEMARTNIGAGTSSFSGSYNDLLDKPEIVQSDWEVSSQSDQSYIKNRTHYTEINIEAIVEKATVYYYPVEVDGEGISLSYALQSFSRLGISDTFNIAQGDILKIDRYRGPTNSQYTYIDTISVELTKVTGRNGYDYVYYVFGNAYLFKNVTNPAPSIDISSDYDNGITYAGYIQFAYLNGELCSDDSVICLMVPVSMTNSTAFDISILSNTIHMLDEKYIPKTIQRVGDDVILSSSTEGSTKKFKITVDDSGTLSATEVT